MKRKTKNLPIPTAENQIKNNSYLYHTKHKWTLWKMGMIIKTLIVLICIVLSITACSNIPKSNDFVVHFIDVGQADSILVQGPSINILIDAGNNEDGDQVISYLKHVGVQKLDYVIGTHPHEDHIGGMDQVIHSFAIGTIIMPKTTHTTHTYEDVLDAIVTKGLKIQTAVSGTVYQRGDVWMTILAPNKTTYKDLNNTSVVVKINYKKTAFIFQGDAEIESEKEILAKGYDITASIIKLGHHGSSSSTSKEYLHKVNPQVAVISVGRNNDYKHPNDSTMKLLKEEGIPVFRTDESGTIVFTSNGNSISCNKQPGSYTSP